MSFRRIVALSFALAMGATVMVGTPAQAAADPVPSKRACSEDVEGGRYACMQVADRTVPSGETVRFTGVLSARAVQNLNQWTRGDNVVCLTRFKTTPEAGGSWPWTTMEAACTTVRRNGGFTINAEFGRKGTFYYGLEMGPCRGSADLCGNGDPGLLGVLGRGDRVVAVRTT